MNISSLVRLLEFSIESQVRILCSSCASPTLQQLIFLLNNNFDLFKSTFNSYLIFYKWISIHSKNYWLNFQVIHSFLSIGRSSFCFCSIWESVWRGCCRITPQPDNLPWEQHIWQSHVWSHCTGIVWWMVVSIRIKK